jgi:hypothetical protein
MENLLSLLFIAVASSGLTYYFTTRSKKEEAITKFKEEKYAKLLLKLQGFCGASANAKTKREFFDELYQAWVYSSDDVIEAINHLIRLIETSRGQDPDQEQGRRALAGVVLAIRKDLLGKTKLDHHAFRYIDVIDPPEGQHRRGK